MQCRLFFMALVVTGLFVRTAAADTVKVSHCYGGDTINAINDGIEPKGSADRPRHSFWPHKGSTEWAEYHFDSPRKLKAMKIYWLDDTPAGHCPVPESWRLFYRKDKKWLPVENPSGFGVSKGEFNRVTFKEVETPALRIEVKSRPGYGSGIIEWRIGDDPKTERAKRLKRLLAQAGRFKIEPRNSELIQLIRRTEGFSHEAHEHFAQLAALRKLSKKLTSDADAGRPPDELEIRKLSDRLTDLQAGQVRRLPKIAFFTRHPLRRPNAAACYIWQSTPERWGCSIRVYDPSRPSTPARTIFSDPKGCIMDMNISHDARTLFFSYKKSNERCWQIYEIGVDGKGLKKISRDPKYYETSAIELPDGDLLFVSTRRGGYTLCQPGPCSNLYVMKRDGTDVRCVSQNTLSDFSPHMLPDGRVLFTRWEYIDRDLTFRQSLWTQNPDGRHYQLFFGNTVRDIGTLWQARPVPGHGNLLVSTFAPHHGWPHGAIGLIDNRPGLEAPRGRGYVWITTEFPNIGDRSYRWSFRDPYPLNDYQFLVAWGKGNKFSLYLMDLCNNKQLIYSAPRMGCYGPLPVRAQPAPPMLTPLDRVERPGVQWGTLMLADVYRGLSGIERGRVKYVQVMEQVRKAYDLTSRAYDQSPLMSYATYYAKKCWGRVPVEPDGSAHFKAPALQEIYFQVLDAEGRELQRMTSAMQLMPGETLGCIGCHEPRQTSPFTSSNGMPAAFKRKPDQPQIPDWGTDGIVDYVKVVQPVLDKYCVKCHSGVNPKAGYDLSGDKTRLFNMSYDNLLGRSKSYRQHNMQTGEMLPGEKARGKPLVHFYWLLRTPSGVNQPLWTGSHASKLLEYIDTKHSGQFIPLEDRQKIYMWIDADVPYYATYFNSRPRSPGYRDLCTDVRTGRELDWYRRRFLGAYNKRCNSCHGGFPHPNDHRRIWDGRFAWMNFSRPEFSSVLTVHLAKEAGGRGIGTKKGGKGEPIFKDKTDPDYINMLNAMKEGRQYMLAHPRVDMPEYHARAQASK